MNRFILAATLAVALVPAHAHAQRPGGQRSDSSARAVLEQRVRARTGEVLQQRLGLTPQQLQRLTPIRERNEQQRRVLIQQEREARAILRAELAAGDSANQARVAQQLERLMTVQRNRLALLQAEQHALAEFLTPVQRARYQGMREMLGRRLQAGLAARAGQQRRAGMHRRPGAQERPGMQPPRPGSRPPRT